MRCPNCQTNNPPLIVNCHNCGTPLKTGLQAGKAQISQTIVEEEECEKLFDFITWPIAAYWAVATVLFLITFKGGLLSNAHHTLGALVHEFGHCFFMTIYGTLAIPSFGFLAGGAFAMGIADISGIQFLLFTGLGYMIWLNREKPVGIAVFTLIGLVYGFTYYSEKWSELTVLYMGHGMELFIGGIFFYRALSGYAVNHGLERIAYMLCTISLFAQNFNFSHQLAHDHQYLAEYELGRENGMLNDFFRMHSEGHLPNSQTIDIAHFHEWMTLITPIFVLGIFLWRRSYLLSLNEEY